MIKYSFVVAVMATVLSACSSSTTLELKNELALARKDAPVVLTRAEVKQLVGEIPAGKVLVVLDAQGVAIPSQVDDLDQDGQWDELALVCDFTAKEVKKLNVNFVDADKAPKFETRTNVHLGLGNKETGFKATDHAFSPEGFVGIPMAYQSESVAWENDVMGFRDYFDCRNAKDLFGKLIPEMLMDKIGTHESGSYHELSSWGMDVLHVGPSLGSGGLALFHNDSLYRLGNTKQFEYQLVSKGPVRSVFDLKYSGWKVDGKDLSAKERITIWPGKYWFQSDVTIMGLDQDSELAIGIVTSHLKDKKAFSFLANKDFQAVATHGVQSLNDDYLGMGILLPANSKVRTGDAPVLSEEIISGSRYNQPVGQTHFVSQKISNKTSARHYFFAAWELENKKWADQENFENMMKVQAEELSSPVTVTIK
ncbi:DUF4861 domain-containing protein [Ancylomarina sp. 16SWW S1-10-2]|uniref:DUF4861 domain-containing protein n=1 Tax=Ancylomarina sp. 16SWW S1-10-2 TaxID=2499681 RepID=UPI0012ADE2DA|nr:DUF4861 domain-containing protein [Ancylomarina sp. 16SWW S1-10-2]MRT93915.1 DUF4861 domain-containing protein [Ancylomarina sp. 16SWW S1-10-2]